MPTLWGFIIGPVKEDASFNHGPLGFADIERLRELFPHNPIWNASMSNLRGAISFRPTREEALMLYDALVAYRQVRTPSADRYLIEGTVFAYSSLKSVFDTLIPFFEKELGLAVAK